MGQSRVIISILVPHVDVAVFQTRALLRILVALQLGDERGLAAFLVAQHQQRLAGGELGAAAGLHLAQQRGPQVLRSLPALAASVLAVSIDQSTVLWTAILGPSHGHGGHYKHL